MNDTDRIAEIHTRVQNASSGPWGRYSVDFREHRSHSVKTATGVVVAFTGYGPDGGTAHQDAEFIANARFYVPWLLDQLEQARAELRETQSSVRFEEQRADGLAKAYEQTRVERDEARRDHAAAANQAMDADEEIAKLRAELATVRATRKHVRAERDQLRGERDRVRSTAVALEQELADAERARQAWIEAVDAELVEVKAKLAEETRKHNATANRLDVAEKQLAETSDNFDRYREADRIIIRANQETSDVESK